MENPFRKHLVSRFECNDFKHESFTLQLKSFLLEEQGNVGFRNVLFLPLINLVVIGVTYVASMCTRVNYVVSIDATENDCPAKFVNDVVLRFPACNCIAKIYALR